MKTNRIYLKVPTLLAFFFLLINSTAFCYDEVKYIVSPGVSGTWSPDTLYVVTVNIHIAEEDTLQILPGTQVEFEKDLRFEVSGVLLAEGSSENRIVFSRVSTSDDKWNGIRLMSAKENTSSWVSKFNYCDFNYINSIDGAALSVNNGVSDITNCNFSNIDSNGVVIQSGCPIETIEFSGNEFNSVIGYPINIYQNFTISSITIHQNSFSDCHAGVVVNVTQVGSILFEDNDISDSQLDVSFLSITGNPSLNSVIVKENTISNITSVSNDPYIVFIEENDQLQEFECISNEVSSSIRMLSLDGCLSALIEDNDFSQSENIVFDHLYHISSDDIVINSDDISQMNLTELHASYSSLYSLIPVTNVSINGCVFNEIEANCFYIHPEQSIGTVSITNNTVTGCNSDFNNGGILRLESEGVSSIESILFSDNSFSGVISNNFGGTAYIALEGCVIDEIVSEHNSYDSQTDNAGGVFYVKCASVTNLSFLDDSIENGVLTDTTSEDGTGGFLSLQVHDAPVSILVEDYTINRAHAYSHGGFMNINIENSDSDISLLKIEDITYRDVQSETGNGGFISLTTLGGIGEVNISGVQTEGLYERMSLSGGFMYINSQRGPTLINISNSTLTEVSSLHHGGHICIMTEGDVNEIFVEGSTFSSNTSSTYEPVAGGAIYLSAANVNETAISNNTFSNLSSSEKGGMIYMEASGAFYSQSYSNNTFEHGNAGGMAGAVYLSADGSMSEQAIFYNNTFSYIQSEGDGGAVFLSLANGEMENGILIQENSFEDCSAGQNGSGGAMFIECNAILDSLMIIQSSYTSCHAATSGGAMFVSAGNIENVFVDGQNTAGFDDCSALQGDGGSIYISSSTYGIQNIQFKNINCDGNQSTVNSSGKGGFVAINSNGDLIKPLILENIHLTGFSSVESGGALYLNFYDYDIIDTVVVSNSIFESCNATADYANGGVVELISGDIMSDISVNNSSFDGCSAGHNGGALNVNAKNIKSVNIFDNDGFTNCEATTGNGGAISINLQGIIDGDVRISHSVFTGNSSLNAGGDGGAISFSGVAGVSGQMNILDSDFSDLKSSGNGGAIAFVADDNASIQRIALRDNTFAGCFASDENSNGGAIYLITGVVADSLTLDKNVTSNCSAGNNGGGFCFDISDAERVVLLGSSSENTFANCTGVNGDGGGVFLSIRDGGLEEVTLTENLFSGSESGANGGGICIYAAGDIIDQIGIQNNTFTGMTAGNNGGGIFIDTGNSSLLNGVLFEGNTFSEMEATSGNGGAVSINANTIPGDVAFGDNTFVGCEAGINGGAVDIEAVSMAGIMIQPTEGALNFENCISQTGNGGAISVALSGGIGNVSVAFSVFQNCSSGNNGGAIAIDSHQALQDVFDVSNSSFISCSSAMNGGSLYVNMNSMDMLSGLSITENTFSQSSATEVDAIGGAIAVFVGNVEHGVLIQENLFEVCSSNGNGGALSLIMDSADTIRVESQISPYGFIDCISTNGFGGAITISVSEGSTELLDLSDNNFSGCNAGANGGALNVTSGTDIVNVVLQNSTFDNIFAGVNGGALAYTLESGATFGTMGFTNNTFSNIVAAIEGGAVVIEGGTVSSIDFNTSMFSSCHVNNGNGGAIHITSNVSDVALSENSFTSCYSANGNGGSIYIDGNASSGASVSLTDIQFNQGNQMTINGGAAYLSEIDIAEVTNCSFWNLQAGTSGGALFLSKIGLVSVDNSSFSRCQVLDEGGAIWMANSNTGAMNITASHFEFNSAQQFGGAIMVNGLSDFSIITSEFLQNNIFTTGTATAGGGAIYSGNTFMCTLTDNIIYDNHAENENPVISTFGGGAFFDLCQEVFIEDNDLRLNKASFGGAIYIEDDIKTNIINNVFALNQGINGGGLAVKSSLATVDSLSVFDNEFLRNVSTYRGGGIFAERDNPCLVRNKFIRNTGYGKGSSVFFSKDVMTAEVYNCIFDRNEDKDNAFSSATLYLDASSSGSFNKERLIVENSSFLNNWPYSAHAIINKDMNDTIFVRNSIFQGNVLQTDSLFNNGSVISDFCRLEGDLFIADHTNVLSGFYPYELDSESYMLSDASYYIDLGNPIELYNDNTLPPGQGEPVNDPGHTGGRYNDFCEECLDRPGAWMYNDSLVVIRTDCDVYRVSFYHSMASDFDHFQWFIDGETFITEENVLEFTYPAEKNILLLAVATSTTESWTMSGRAWIYNREIVHDGIEISYSPDGTLASGKAGEVEIEIVYGEDCLENIELKATLQNLIIPDFDSYLYEWNVLSGEGVSDAFVSDMDEDEATLICSIDKEYIGTDNLFVTLSYSGEDGCGLQCSDEVIIRLTTTGFMPLEVESITPVDGDAVVFDQFFLVDITMNQMCGYLNDGNYTEIPLETDIDILQLVAFLDETGPLEMDSVIAVVNDQKLQLQIYPDTTQITFDKTYTVNISENLVSVCGWSVEVFEYEFSTVETGIDDYSFNISIHPNPVQTTLVVRSDRDLTGAMRVLTVSGEILYQRDIMNENELYIDMTALNKGFYILEIVGDEGRFIRKIIKE